MSTHRIRGFTAPAPGDLTTVTVAGRAIAVTVDDGQAYAFDDACTHLQCSLSGGEVEDGEVICPCHFAAFDIATGAVRTGPAQTALRLLSRAARGRRPHHRSTRVKPNRVVIVGASLAGATTAFALRETGFEGDIVLFGAEAELPYERPALSKGYLMENVPADKLLVRTAEAYDEHRIELRLGRSVTSLDVDRQNVTLDSGDVLHYTLAIVATGASNLRPPIPGLGLARVHQLRTVADADALRDELPDLRAAVVAGQGFIGCEITSTLTSMCVDVTAVDAAPGPLWGPLGSELTSVVGRWHDDRGVRLVNGLGVSAFVPDQTGPRVSAVELADGRRLEHRQPRLPDRLAPRPHDRQTPPWSVDRVRWNDHTVHRWPAGRPPRAQASQPPGRHQGGRASMTCSARTGPPWRT
jgi:nitrite reductase/ring-hydroxylating ferredoxin subunit